MECVARRVLADAPVREMTEALVFGWARAETCVTRQGQPKITVTQCASAHSPTVLGASRSNAPCMKRRVDGGPGIAHENSPPNTRTRPVGQRSERVHAGMKNDKSRDGHVSRPGLALSCCLQP